MGKKLYLFFLILLSLVILPVSSISASSKRGLKNNTYFFVGYSANIPKQLVGIDFYFSFPKFVGISLDLKSETPSIEQMSNTLIYSIEQVNLWGDSFLGKRGQWGSASGALTLPLSKSVSIYGGAGVSIYHEYRRYYDRLQILGNNGYYWIEDTTKPKTKINYLGGLLCKLGDNFAVQLGAQTQPFGITAGISYGIVLKAPNWRGNGIYGGDDENYDDE